MTQIAFVEIISLIQIKERNQLMKEGPMDGYHQPTPMNESMEGLAEDMSAQSTIGYNFPIDPY
jgi:hypothetical protein